MWCRCAGVTNIASHWRILLSTPDMTRYFVFSYTVNWVFGVASDSVTVMGTMGGRWINATGTLNDQSMGVGIHPESKCVLMLVSFFA